MATPILMPKAGQSMTEGKIISWLKKEGDPIERGEPILEIETDKANLEVEAQSPGVLRKVFHGTGAVCPVFTVIGVIGEAREAIDFEAIQKAAPPQEESAGGAGAPGAAALLTAAPAAVGAQPAAAPQAAASEAAAPGAALAQAPAAQAAERVPAPEPGGARRVAASPLARRVARERAVDLSRLRGTGPGGRILRRDVESAPAIVTQTPSWLAEAIPATPARRYPPPSPRPPERVPVEGMRKAIGAALQQSKQVIPHFYATVSVDVTDSLALKKALDSRGVKVSLNDMILRACALALEDEPRVNCRVFPDRIEYPADANIGIAVGHEHGLVVPVILRAQTRDLAGIAAESRRVIGAAGKGKLIGSGQGTFTISNLGMHGVESFTAIINPPEGAILAVGAAVSTLVSFAGGFVPRSILKATLSSDHRAIDGLLAARFLARIKHLLESPERL